jgi:methylated-DNA-[protein]-cysteine S-methyltransferase
MLRFGGTDTPLGRLSVVMTDSGVAATTSGPCEPLVAALERRYAADARRGGPSVALALREIDRYFDGALRAFETPVDLGAAPTPLIAAMWRAARAIHYGALRTYGDLAANAGAPGAARAAGAAMRRCPVELFVPCHRVVRSGPALGSYGGDDQRRLALLRLEGSVPVASVRRGRSRSPTG